MVSFSNSAMTTDNDDLLDSHLDMLNLLTYNLRDSQDYELGFHSALYPSRTEPTGEKYLSVVRKL